MIPRRRSACGAARRPTCVASLPCSTELREVSSTRPLRRLGRRGRALGRPHPVPQGTGRSSDSASTSPPSRAWRDSQGCALYGHAGTDRADTSVRFDRGLDSGNLDPNHEAVKVNAVQQRLARILKRCNDPLAPRLFEFDKGSLLRPTLRNTSVLVHGFVARAPDDPVPLHELFGALELLVREDGGPAVAERLRVARSPAFHVG